MLLPVEEANKIRVFDRQPDKPKQTNAVIVKPSF